MTKHVNLYLRPIAFMVLLFSTVSAYGDDLSVPADIAATIEKTLPGATILSQGDINEKSCGRIPKTPGIVRGDFNGDGRLDFAALLKLRTTGKSVHWQGKTLQETEFAFAIFLDDGHGAFTSVYVHRFKDLSPVLAYIDLRPPGKITGVGESPSLTLKNSAISFVNCEKSEAVYYLSGSHVQIHWVSD
jgi:hypothetical protein